MANGSLSGRLVRPRFLPEPSQSTDDSSSLSEAAETDLRRSADRLLGDWDASSEGYGEAEITTELDRLIARIRLRLREAESHGENASPAENGSPDGADQPRGARLVLSRRLLDLLRAELVRAWRDEETGLNRNGLVEMMSALEAVREDLEGDDDMDFARLLAGPRGLELLAEVAHDLRSPLTSILTLAEALRRGQSGNVNDVQKRQLGLIYSAALGLSTTASDVTELAHDHACLSEERCPLSISEIFESVQDIVRPMAEEKGLDIHLIPTEVDQRMGYALALSRALLNLTTNALKFTEEGYVELRADAKGPAEIEFSVRDTGRGIEPDSLNTLYRIFRRDPGYGGYCFSGTGLGLMICRRLVRAMGGELEVDTAPEWGTRFYFTLHLPPSGNDSLRYRR